MIREINDMVSVISEWVRCPVCGNKTRLQIRADTELKNVPLYFRRRFPDLIYTAHNCSFAVFKILRQSGESLCINIAALKPRATISFFYAIVLFPGFRTQITITAAVAMRNSANTTGFPIISVS